MPQDPKSPLAQKIEQIGDRADEVLASAQTSVSKVLKRLAAIVGAVAIGLTVGYQVLKGFQEKTAPVFEKSGVETVETKQGSKVFRVRGR
jgi:hypothetical protein